MVGVVDGSGNRQRNAHDVPEAHANLYAYWPGIHGAAADARLDYSGNGRHWTNNGTIAVGTTARACRGALRSSSGRGCSLPRPRRRHSSLTRSSHGLGTDIRRHASRRAGRIHARARRGCYAITGVAANLRVGRRVTADAGSYAVTGVAATLKYGRKLAGTAGSYTLTGLRQPCGRALDCGRCGLVFDQRAGRDAALRARAVGRCRAPTR